MNIVDGETGRIIFCVYVHALMLQRLGLRRADETDYRLIVEPLLKLMSHSKLDYAQTFRKLAQMPSSGDGNTFPSNQNTFPDDKLCSFARVLSTPTLPTPEDLSPDRPIQDWHEWSKRFQARVESELTMDYDMRQWRQNLLRFNPRFVLRQWVLEEVIQSCEEGGDGKKLKKAMKLIQDDDRCSIGMNLEGEGFCGIGSRSMLGFQCSCSS